MEKFSTLAQVQEWAAHHTGSECVQLYNSLPNVKPVARFTDRSTAAMRIWRAMSQPVVEGKEAGILETEAAEPLAERKPAKAPQQRAKRKPKVAVRKPGSARKSAKTTAHSNGGRVAEVIALASRKNGVTLDELCTAFTWQRHSARGFVSILQSKHGVKITSARVDGARVYSI